MYNPKLITQQMQRILDDECFASSERARKFLKFIVNETLAERDDQLKEWTIALNVFGKGMEFNPQLDPIVRIEAGRLRKRLEQYYRENGQNEPIRIVVPKGGYIPQFYANNQPEPEESHSSEVSRKPVLEIASFHTEDAGEEDHFLASYIREELIRVFGSCEDFSLTLEGNGNTNYRLKGRVLKQRSSRFLYLYLIHPPDEEIIWSDHYKLKVRRGVLSDAGAGLFRTISFNLLEEGGVIYQDLARRLPGTIPGTLSTTEWTALFLQHRREMTEPNCRKLIKAIGEHNRWFPDNPDLIIMEAHLCWDLSVDLLWEENTKSPESAPFYQRACRLTEQVITDYPENGEANLAAARKSFYRKDRNSFYKYTETALEVGLKSPLSRSYLAWLTALCGDWEKGLSMLNRYRSRLPFAPGWFSRADCQYYLRQMDYEVVLEKARDFSFPHNPWYHLYSAAALGLMENREEARNHYTNLLALEPRFPRIYLDFLSTYILQEEILNLVLAGLEQGGLSPSSS
ncbi:MAG: hypothetical protein K9L68_11875 [Spirochaetales bacterium]|nr:hypothetical protein [Spirochaetales bacterium]MCF7939288.1 hypothetical protein [Spirochaetales bacterium]